MLVDDVGSTLPVISVLLPVYNAERYIRAAMESVLAQTLGDFELLALDDGSGDSSLRILREYEAQDRRVHVFGRENRGLVPTLNELIAKARGRYLARMDADDIALPRRFERQVEFLDEMRGHVLVGGLVEHINDVGQPIGIICSPLSHDEIDLAHLKGHTSICHPAAMIRREALLRVGSYDVECEGAEDLDLWLRLAEVGEVANIPEVVLQYRLHRNSISESKGQQQRVAMRRACTSAWQRRDIDGEFAPTEHWRPAYDKTSQHKFALQYGWVAWNHNHRETWRSYAWQAICFRPFALSSWGLLIFGLIKRPPKQGGLAK